MLIWRRVRRSIRAREGVLDVERREHFEETTGWAEPTVARSEGQVQFRVTLPPRALLVNLKATVFCPCRTFHCSSQVHSSRRSCFPSQVRYSCGAGRFGRVRDHRQCPADPHYSDPERRWCRDRVPRPSFVLWGGVADPNMLRRAEIRRCWVEGIDRSSSGSGTTSPTSGEHETSFRLRSRSPCSSAG